MNIERALKNIGDWISKETESRKYPKSELLELSESLQALKAVSNQYLHDAILTALRQYQKPSKWIPVSERLPTEELASVLVYTKEGGVAEGQYYPTIKSWKQFRWSVENATVTHWMPLPEPPKGE